MVQHRKIRNNMTLPLKKGRRAEVGWRNGAVGIWGGDRMLASLLLLMKLWTTSCKFNMFFFLDEFNGNESSNFS